MRNFKNILVTGGCGFIGSNFIRFIFEQEKYQGKIYNLDLLTYAGNPENLVDITEQFQEQYFFIKGDIRDKNLVETILVKNNIDCIINFAAETHVDRAIHGPLNFITTNINGTFNLLESCRSVWKDFTGKLFHHVSTDEVYGSLGETGYFYEDTPYDPRSPYSAAKAASDHLVMAYYHTYKLPVTISNCSNNYGPYQFPEKLIPLMIDKIVSEEALPIYGDGKNVRDWLYVEDHCKGIHTIIHNGGLGQTYNIGGNSERQNIQIVNLLCQEIARIKSKNKDYYQKLITYVTDRPGHDKRYAIDCNKIKNELGWEPETSFEKGMLKTINWYLENGTWIENIKSGDYQNWLNINYKERK